MTADVERIRADPLLNSKTNSKRPCGCVAVQRKRECGWHRCRKQRVTFVRIDESPLKFAWYQLQSACAQVVQLPNAAQDVHKPHSGASKQPRAQKVRHSSLVAYAACEHAHLVIACVHYQNSTRAGSASPVAHSLQLPLSASSACSLDMQNQLSHVLLRAPCSHVIVVHGARDQQNLLIVITTTNHGTVVSTYWTAPRERAITL